MGEYDGMIFCAHFSNSMCMFFENGECPYENDWEAYECMGYCIDEDGFSALETEE